MRSTYLLGGLILIVACAKAGGEATGGELVADAGALTPLPAPCDVSGLADVDCGTGTKWSEIYRDILGPTSKAGSCSIQSSCHGTEEGDGARSPAGVQCYDEKGCRQSFIDRGLVSTTDAKDPAKSSLMSALLRLCTNGKQSGYMPNYPLNYVYPPKCVERINGWIAAGIQDD